MVKPSLLYLSTPKQVYDDQIKLKREHEAIGRENQGEDQGERKPSDLTKPKPLQLIQTLIQTQTNQAIQPQLKNTQIWSRVEVRQEERRKSGVMRIVWRT